MQIVKIFSSSESLLMSCCFWLELFLLQHFCLVIYLCNTANWNMFVISAVTCFTKVWLDAKNRHFYNSYIDRYSSVYEWPIMRLRHSLPHIMSYLFRCRLNNKDMKGSIFLEFSTYKYWHIARENYFLLMSILAEAPLKAIRTSTFNGCNIKRLKESR